jgi:hypothetical protein
MIVRWKEEVVKKDEETRTISKNKGGSTHFRLY